MLYFKLLANVKQLPAFPLKVRGGIQTPIAEVGGECITTMGFTDMGSTWFFRGRFFLESHECGFRWSFMNLSQVFGGFVVSKFGI